MCVCMSMHTSACTRLWHVRAHSAHVFTHMCIYVNGMFVHTHAHLYAHTHIGE